MSDARETGGARPPGAWRAGGLLALIAVLGVGLLAIVHDLTRERIAAQERAAMEARLAEVLDPARYDNDPLADSFVETAPGLLGHDRPVRVYRARRDGRPVAVLLETLAPDGYNGDILLLVGIDATGVVTGVRVLRHRETPGLGDPIEARRSDWIEGFRGRALGDPPRARWTVRKDGGDFDQFTGATITPRAVTRAVARSLDLAEARRATWFETE